MCILSWFILIFKKKKRCRPNKSKTTFILVNYALKAFPVRVTLNSIFNLFMKALNILASNVIKVLHNLVI